jgi:hypothetical protein
VNLPRSHHYNPVFYLSQWVGDDGCVCEMRFIRGKVVPKRKHPQNTGRIKDLYRTNGVPEANSQDLELKFMTPLDTDAAAALWKLLEGEPLGLEERVAWTRFLLSLVYRNPDVVQLIRTHMAMLAAEATASLESDWAARRGSNDTSTLAEVSAIRAPGLADTHAANLIADIIGNHRAVPDIVRMNWGKIGLSGSRVPLVTSDRPVLLTVLSDPQAFIALPIGPYDLFVAAFDDRFSRMQRDATEVAQIVNRDVIASAREFVWGVDDGEIDVVRTWIGANPDRVVLSKEQQEASIAAARGVTPGD